MPIYEYKCKVCDYKFDKLQKINDDPLRLCPDCNNDSLEKLVSAAGFRLSGSGWYETDFKSGTEKKKNLAENNNSDKKDSTNTNSDNKATAANNANTNNSNASSAA